MNLKLLKYNVMVRKIKGFYDELTPLQIEKVINDYKLKYN